MNETGRTPRIETRTAVISFATPPTCSARGYFSCLSSKSCMLLVNHHWTWTRGHLILGAPVNIVNKDVEQVEPKELAECRYAMLPVDHEDGFKSRAGAAWRARRCSKPDQGSVADHLPRGQPARRGAVALHTASRPDSALDGDLEGSGCGTGPPRPR